MNTQSPPTPPTPGQAIVWHTLGIDGALEQQGVRLDTGLRSADAAQRLATFGPNTFNVAQKEPGWSAFLRQFRDPMQIVLLVAGVVSCLAIQQW